MLRNGGEAGGGGGGGGGGGAPAADDTPQEQVTIWWNNKHILKKDANWRSNFCAQLSKFIWAEHFHYLSSKHKNIFTLSITGGAYEWWYDPQDTYICVTLWVVTLRQWMIDERLMWQLCHSNQCQLDSKGNVVTENFQLAILEQKWAI